MRGLRLAVSLSTITLMSAGMAGLSTASAVADVAAPHSGILPPKNPSRSLSPDPDFFSYAPCFSAPDGRACNSEVLKAIAHGRKVLENIGGMSFSLSAYEKLTPVEQIFVTADLERTERGLPPATVLTRSLDKVAQVGANDNEDPPLNEVPDPLPGGGRLAGLGGNWAGGFPNALGADYAWMYDDGLGSGNLDCTKTHKSGCWGHRDNILGTFSSSSDCGGGSHELAMGAGYTAKSKSLTELFAGVCGPTPTDVVFTWAKATSLLHIKK
jgi:hypothetical protein